MSDNCKSGESQSFDLLSEDENPRFHSERIRSLRVGVQSLIEDLDIGNILKERIPELKKSRDLLWSAPLSTDLSQIEAQLRSISEELHETLVRLKILQEKIAARYNEGDQVVLKEETFSPGMFATVTGKSKTKEGIKLMIVMLNGAKTTLFASRVRPITPDEPLQVFHERAIFIREYCANISCKWDEFIRVWQKSEAVIQTVNDFASKIVEAFPEQEHDYIVNCILNTASKLFKDSLKKSQQVFINSIRNSLIGNLESMNAEAADKIAADVFEFIMKEKTRDARSEVHAQVSLRHHR